MKKVVLLIITVIFLGLGIKAYAAYPDYKGYVNDFANVLSDGAEQAISQEIATEDKQTTNQIAVVTVNTTQPEEIEDYSIHLASQWKPGQKGKDNGILMVFAMNDRKMRIEVGRGLEDDLTDIEAKNIEDNVIRPEFKAGRYDEGVEKGVHAVIVAVHTADEATAPTTPANKGESGSAIAFVVLVVLIGGGIFLVWLAHSPHTPFGGEGDNNVRGVWVPKKGSKYGTKTIGKIDKEVFIPLVPPIIASSFPSTFRQSSYSSNQGLPSSQQSSYTSYSNDDDDDDSSFGSFGGGSSSGGWGGISFGGGSFSGGGASSGW